MSSTLLGGISWRDIARAAYHAYAASTGNRSAMGDPLPAFDFLPVEAQVAWEAAVRHADDFARTTDGREPPGVERWRGWKPARLRDG